jgi:hypothetical protein
VAGQAFLHVAKVAVPQSVTITHVTALVLPWAAPAYQGFIGTTLASEAEPALLLAGEWPLSWMRSRDAVPKFDLEWLHLRRLSSDHALATGAHAFADVQPGADPPDATVLTGDGRIGVEATALTIEGRREVHNLFLKLRQRLQASEPAAFVRLIGRLVYVWFDSPDAPVGKPFKRTDEAALDGLVEALAKYEPRDEQVSSESVDLPESLPSLPLEVTAEGANFYAVPLANAVPGSMLFTLAGFEIALVYTTMLTASGAWAEVQRLVDKHDKPGVELLVITAAGPDPSGTIYPLEEALAQFLIDHPLGLRPEPEHIKRVVLHRWMTGHAATLHPTVEPIFGPLYGSLVPVHHPFVIPLEQPDAPDPSPPPSASPTASSPPSPL